MTPLFINRINNTFSLSVLTMRISPMTTLAALWYISITNYQPRPLLKAFHGYQAACASSSGTTGEHMVVTLSLYCCSDRWEVCVIFTVTCHQSMYVFNINTLMIKIYWYTVSNIDIWSGANEPSQWIFIEPLKLRSFVRWTVRITSTINYTS